MPLARPPAPVDPADIVAVAADLDRRIKDYIARSTFDDDVFERLALDLYAYQYAANEPYRAYCDRIGRPPDLLRRWIDVPALPTSAFSQLRFACFPPERTKASFLSSGTTRSNRSRLELEDLSLYDASLLAQFKRMVLPDAARIRFIVLAPPFFEAPNSSLSYMFSRLSEVYGTAEDGFYLHDDELDYDGAARALREASEPMLVAGTAFAFVHFFDRAIESGADFALPRGSRVIETGGFKGRSRTVERDELYGWFTQILGVPREMCAAEYGMCELGSQWYEGNIADAFADRWPHFEVKVAPNWAGHVIVDRVTAQPLHDAGEPGLLQVFDLSNRGSVCAVLTSDLARDTDGGFFLMGRA
ncbi:MAG: hypothetical protein JO293_07005, partial [Candidatus Eremiobacteraeota bacterium]|nr:hypothetical protein [Candidatus Eremiobacteraeota bacterium]